MSKIKERKAGAIRENLGHAQVSKEIRKINKTAATLFERTVQKDTEEAESSQKELYRLTHNPMFSNMAEMPR